MDVISYFDILRLVKVQDVKGVTKLLTAPYQWF